MSLRAPLFVVLPVLAVACATPGPGVSEILNAGSRVSAPRGLVSYCAGRLECAEATDEDGNPWRGGSGSDPRKELFHAILDTRLTANTAMARATGERVILTAAAWQELAEVNREINARIHPRSDRDLYGVEEYWTRPLVSGGVEGDCEDSALEKRARLLELNWSAESLALGQALVPGRGLHVVLIVMTDRGDWVLDSLRDEPSSLRDLSYIWVSRQIGPGLTTWAVVGNVDETVR